MKKIIRKFLSFFILGFFLLPTLARADGGIMPPPDHWVYETGQKGAIFYQDKTETLVLQTSFSGNAEDFAYIVPTPSQPEITKVSDDIFSNLAELTEEVTVMKGAGIGVMMAPKVAEEAVTIVEEKQVGIYEIKVLTATDANALYDWLQENNFTYPASKKYILDDYIQNKWFFTTAKISTEAITSDIEIKLKKGQLTPLRLVFPTENLVYPLKISAVVDETAIEENFQTLESEWEETLSEEEKAIFSTVVQPSNSIPITLYIFTDHKQEISDFTIKYANWIKAQEIEKLAKDDNGNPWVRPQKKMYLTKLYRSMEYSEMSNDLFPNAADDDKKVGVASWWERAINWFSGIGLLLVYVFFVLLFFTLCYWQFTPRSKKCHLICWILQILSFVIVTLPLLIIFVYLVLGALSYGLIYTTEWVILVISSIFLVGLPVVMLVLMLTEHYLQKKRGYKSK